MHLPKQHVARQSPFPVAVIALVPTLVLFGTSPIVVVPNRVSFDAFPPRRRWQLPVQPRYGLVLLALALVRQRYWLLPLQSYRGVEGLG